MPQHFAVQPIQSQNRGHYDSLNFLDLSANNAHGISHDSIDPPRLSTQFAAVVLPGLSSTVPTEGSGDEVDEEEIAEEADASNDQNLAHMTASERVAQKRRMKRFRLTHVQTRYLINEFIQQPNPDAAHRDRLSARIPGLSPRQVQVWFQNRRAKLKRLSPEDRARMLKSRSVPDEFSTSRATRPTATSTIITSEVAEEPWMSESPGTSIQSMCDLKQLFAEGFDAMHAPDDARIREQIQSVISQNSYPSPLSASESSFSVRHHDIRRATRSNERAKDSRLAGEGYPDAAYHRTLWDRSTRQEYRCTALIFGPDIPDHQDGSVSHDDRYSPDEP